MLREIILFEVRYQLKSPIVPMAAVLFFLITFGAVTTDSVTVGGAIGNVNRNAPFVIMQLLTMMSVIGIFAITAFVAGSVQRDFERNTHEIFFSTPARKIDYLAGRFLGSMVTSLLVLAAPALGILAGSFMPWLAPERLGPFSAVPYIYTFLLFVVPNALFLGSVFFTLAGTTKNMLFTYLGVVAFFVLYSLAGVLGEHMENRTLAALIDPFGLAAQNVATRYWTIVERNTLLPGVGGVIAANRLIWFGVAVAVFAAGYVLFRHEPRKKRAARSSRSGGASMRRIAPGSRREAALPAVINRPKPSFTAGTTFLQFLRQVSFETTAILKSVPFIVILAFGILNVAGNANSIGERFGTSIYPVTHLMLQSMSNAYSFLLVIIITFYAGELIWRERSLKLHEVIDALPVPDGALLAAKTIALFAVTTVFLLFGVLASMGIQLFHGYHRFEPLLYLKGIAVQGVPFLFAAVLALFVQVVSRNRFFGYLVMILFLISRAVFALLDFNHVLYSYGGLGAMPYSDMNGYGAFVERALSLGVYWTFCSAILFVAALLLWRRGTGDAAPVGRRLAAIGRRRGAATALAISAAGFVVAGVWIYWNTNIRNDYVSPKEARARSAEYEKKYRPMKDAKLPRIAAVRADVDIYPHERNVSIRGTYTTVNRWAVPVDSIYISINPSVVIRKIDIPGSKMVFDDAKLGYYIYRLDAPLAPGDTLPIHFDVAVVSRGFVNDGWNTRVVHNGTFFNNTDFFPMLGYDESRQLIDRNRRRQNGLPPVERMAPVGDLFARRNSYISREADWIDFETVVSTSSDQIAIAPGYLQKEWEKDDRRYFHYTMDAPIMDFYSFLSARWEVRRGEWRGMPVEVYYQKGHEYNIDRMIDAAKKSLDYCSANFSPYQHRQLRILEFPGYAAFAQSFSNTIPFSESIGFIANIEKDDDIDYVFYVTAHEVAHQWWGHQLLGANVQGATLLSESLAQYSALMVMEKEFGREKMRKFLKYELDNYLKNRSGELVEEMPLLLVENQQYIHYNKGSVVLYALRDYIGEEKLNRALSDYLAEKAFQGPPWTVSLDLLDHLEAVTPDSLRYVLEDMFETITLFENRMVEAHGSPEGDGRYVVTLEADAKKVRADGHGVETPVPIDDWIDIGVFADTVTAAGKKEERVLYLKKHHITGDPVKITVTVDAKPARAGIDPYNKLIDRNSDDNVIKVILRRDGGV